MDQPVGLPAVRRIEATAPLGWLAGGWSDLWKAPGPCLAYGLVIALVSFGLCYGLYVSNAAFWALVLTLGFVFVAPVLAMGPYEAGRRLEQGERPRLGQILFVRPAFRQDVAYLGLALLLIYLFWGRIAQIVFALSTYQLYPTVPEFIQFAIGTTEGHNMMVAGTLVGGAIAFLTYTLVVVSAPMLLDPRVNVFVATVTSFRTVAANPGAMLLWAVVIVALLLLSAATGFAALVVVFPWLGLASWRAYRALVADEPAPAGLAPA